MKLIYFYLIAIIFFMFLPVSVVLAGACTPDPGYDYCWDYYYSGCLAEVQFTGLRDITGVYQSPMVQKAYINVKSGGAYETKKLYVYRGLTSWSQVSCGSSGCNGTQISDGQYVVGTTGDKNPLYAAFVVWVYNESGPPWNEWCWAWVGYGWVGSPNYWPLEIVECTQDTHCTAQAGGICQADHTCLYSSPPNVTTEIATVNVQNDQATLKGNVTDTGGVNPDHRYIDWDTDSGEPYAHTEDLGSGGTGEYSTTINITPGTIYYYRARAHNSIGDGKGAEKKVVIYTASGDQQQFTTLSADNPPDITISCPECAPIKNLGDVVSVTVSATDDNGLDVIYFYIYGEQPNHRYERYFCGGTTFCSHTWDVTLDYAGTDPASYDWTFWGIAADNQVQWSDWVLTHVKDVFDFNLSVSPNSGSVIQGESIPTTVTANLLSSATRSVSFSASGLPSGASASFSPASCNPACNSTVTITTSPTTPGGTYSIIIKGTNGNLVRTTTYDLTVTGTCPLSGSTCSSPEGSISCGGTLSGCLNTSDWKYYNVLGSAGKEVTVTLTYSGTGCNVNDLYIYNSSCSTLYYSTGNLWTETWTGTPTTDIRIGIDGDSSNSNCQWNLSVNCVTIYTLSVSKAGTGSGTVTSSPSGINCGTDCSESYISGTSVTLTANPSSGSQFAGWSGDCEGGALLSDDFDPDIDLGGWSALSNASADTSCGSVSGNALRFTNTGTRSAATQDLDTNSGGTVSFYLKFGTGSLASGCENADGGEDVVLEYSTNGGSTWTKIATYDTEAYLSFTSITENISPGAQTSATRFRWRQLSHSGSNYDNWAIDNLIISGAGGGGNTCVVTMDSAKSVIATFNKISYTLSGTITGTGSGTVTVIAPTGAIDHRTDFTETYDSGTSVTLTTTPDSGSYFADWSGDCSGTGSCTLTMDADKDVTAVFHRITYTLSVSKEGTGSGTVTDTGINCGTDCSESYSSGTSVTLTANPSLGSYFAGWSGDCSGTGSCTLIMDSAKSVTATFNPSDTTAPTVSVAGAPADWQNTNTQASVSCTDTGSGCDTATYRLRTYTSNPGSCPTVYTNYTLTSPRTITSHQWVCGTAKDMVGNPGFSSLAEFKIDKTNPSSAVTNPAAGSWHNNDFTVTLDDSDTGGSDLAASCQYLIVGLNPDPIGDDCSSGILSRSCDPVTKNVPVGSGSCSVSNICIFEGENRCRANTQSFDNAGNSSGWQSRNFSIDYTPPVVGQVSPLTAIKGKETTFSASVSDSVSQILGCYFYEGVNLLSSDVTFSNIPCTECEVSVDYAFDTTGDHENVYFMCWDKAQNIGTGNPVTIRVEPKPTLAVDLSAEPSVGADSLYNVDLTATVSGTMSGAINYKFDCTNDGSWELEINNTDINPYTAIDLCDYPVIGTYTAKVFIQRGESCGTVVECTDEYLASNPVEYCCQEKKVSINVVADQPPICQISVPENGVVNIWIEINVSGSSDPEGVLSNVRFSSDNNLNGSVDGGWNPATGYYNWNSSSGNWNATNKTMKWSFAQTGDYEVWAEVKDDVNQTTACYDTIIITECFPGETKGCTSIQGCNHTLTCQVNGTWPSCPIDECTQGTTQSCGVDGTQTCTNVCTWGTCVEPGTCSPTPPSCPICQHPECISDEWTCQPDSVGTDCGDCRLCDGVGYCNYICLGAESSCECISDSCIDCSNYYDGGCNYYSCGSLEKPVWSCSGGNCQYSCQYDATCEGDGDGNGDGNGNGLPLECEREYPDVYLSPSSQFGTAGDQLLYTISVVNNDTNCDTSTFSLTKSCPSGWACSLDTTSLIISPGYSNSTILRVTSPSPPYTKGNYEVSVTATNSGVPEYFHTGYAIYQVGNNPPTAAISCYPSGCSQSSGSCTGYTRSAFCLKNNSYDLDGISDIKKSNWNITGPVSQSSVCISDPLCNWTLPSHFTAGSYGALLYVEDQAGATSTASKNFTLLQDIIADFECSLVPDEGWTEDCGALKVSVDEVVFFKDTSIPSSGATILDSGYNWTAVDGKFVKPTNKSSKNPQISFKKEDVASGTVILEVTDSAGRSDTVSQKIWLTQPLPEWQEVPPF